MKALIQACACAKGVGQIEVDEHLIVAKWQAAQPMITTRLLTGNGTGVCG